METQSNRLKQRTRGEATTTGSKRSRDEKRKAMRRGFRSLAVAVGVPVSLNLLSIHLGGSNTSSFWFLPLWALHFTSIASAFLMGLSAWLIWAESGFHKKPIALFLYLAHLAFALAWDPFVFRARSSLAGFIVCLASLGALFGCFTQFKHLNPIAAHLMKPCLACNAFLAILNLKLLLVN